MFVELHVRSSRHVIQEPSMHFRCCEVMSKKPFRSGTRHCGWSVSPGQTSLAKEGESEGGRERGGEGLVSVSHHHPARASPDCMLLLFAPFSLHQITPWTDLSRMADAMQHNSTYLPLLELPAPCLRVVCLALWSHPRDLAALSVVCTATRTLVDDTQLWKEVLLRRYGRAALPEEAPAGRAAGAAAYQPVQLQGWVFCAGLDASSDTDEAAEGAWDTVQQLADACSRQGGQAFTTGGKLISSCPARASWRRSSYRPYQGTYVRADIAVALELQGDTPDASAAGPAAAHTHAAAARTEAAAAATAAAAASCLWPPVVPGWVYFPSCYSPGFTARDGPSNLESHSSLAALLLASDVQTRVVAVTTDGETKSKLRPQWCWRTVSSYDGGMYVKQELVDRMRLTPQPPVPDYRALAAQLSRLRVCGAQMDAVWLNDEYLTLRDVDATVGCNGTALQLNSVWWLDISGDITGVAPGEYEVVWVIDAHPAHMRYEGPTYSMSAAAEPLGLEPMPEHSFGGPTAAGAGAGGSMDSAGTGAGAGASAGNSSMTAAGAVIATAAGVVDYMRRMRALWLGQAPQATTSSSSGVSADAGNSSGGQAQGSGSSVSISMNERQMVHSLRPTHQWGALPAGRISVTGISNVHVRFWSHEGWKSRLGWAYAELRPVLSPAQEQLEEERRRQWREWWTQRRHTARMTALLRRLPGAGSIGA